jgi:D-alanyl-D-alanine carboxypeptidase
MPGAIIAACMLVATAATPTRQPPGAAVSQMRAVQRAVDAFVAQPGGPPGAIVVVQRDASRRVFRAGVADISRHSPIGLLDHMRVASVAKAYSGATALALVADRAERVGVDRGFDRELRRLKVFVS